MADESINCSPQKVNRSIHRSRLQRKTKRLNATYTKLAESHCSNTDTFPSNDDRSGDDELSGTLLVMYDSEEFEGININVENTYTLPEKLRFELESNFDPFAEQRLLVVADHCRTPSHRSSSFVATHGFEPSNKLLFPPPEQPTVKSSVFKSNTNEEFEITDSELLQVCEETEKNANNTNIEQERSDFFEQSIKPELRQKPKSIVDLILEDFCGSPEPQPSSEESSFHFRFANKPLRTYSKRRHENTVARQNAAERYGHVADSEMSCGMHDGDLLSNDSLSDLSVQEDLTQLIPSTNVEEVVELQHSQSLCDNLQNLSAYFSDLSGILDTKQNKSDKSSGIQQNYEKECLPSFEGYISAEEDFKGFPSEDENAFADIKLVPNQHCDTAKNKEDIDILDEDGDWNDECDFFAKFDMEVALEGYKKDTFGVNNKTNASPPKENVGFRTASNKAVIISAEAKARANIILQELPPLPTNTSYTDDPIVNALDTNEIQHVDHTTTLPINTKMDLLVNNANLSQTPKKEIISIKRNNSNDREGNPVFGKSLLNLTRQNLIGNYDIPESSRVRNNEKRCFDGFLTASDKEITVSEKAQQQAAKILEKLPPLQQERANIINGIPSTCAVSSNKSFLGFRTASHKAIKISKEAQERASKILEELPELNIAEEFQTNNEKAIYAPPDNHFCTGFRTASRKTVIISEEAQKCAAIIIRDVIKENLEQHPEECLTNLKFSEWPVQEELYPEQIEGKATSSVNTCTMNVAAGGEQFESTLKKTKDSAKLEFERFDNVIFSEWPLPEAFEDFECEQVSKSGGSSKRKRDEEQSSAQHTPKKNCKSMCMQRSPLTHIQPSVQRSSLSELAVKTPPDYRASRGIIARKNLLSLNKRQKLNGKSLLQCKEFNNDSNESKTPTKKSSTVEPQSPPETPNLREFFASTSISTSTPHPPPREDTYMRTRARKRAELKVAATTTPTNEASLKRIDWNNETLNNNVSSINTSRLSNSSCSNITKIESNPTPKKRIERLRMYGKPPSVSPIYMSSTNNCRISGLKRHARSVSKVEPKNEKGSI